MYPGQIHGRACVEPEGGNAKHHGDDRVGNRAPTRRPSDQAQLAATGHDGRRHRAEHPLAGHYQVGRGADVATDIRFSRLPVEVPHLVVEKEPRPSHNDARAIPAFEGVGVGDGIPRRIDHGKMRRLLGFAAIRDDAPA
jgi:hypothetical protein